MWHEFDATHAAAELRAMSNFGVRVVRTMLPWDVFMPDRHAVPPARLRDVETFLRIAAEQSLAVVPVLFVQSLGDCVMLPAYAIDVRAPRPGVRVLTDAVVQPGGPRDMYTDTLMLDTALTWLDAMLAAFAGHPAVACWDLGHDPATAMRPRRIDDLRRWTALLSARVHERGERCTLTLSTSDILVARGVRPHALAPELDAVGMVLEPARLRSASATDANAAVFLLQLTNTVMESAHHVVATIEGDGEDDAVAVAAYARNATAGLIESGAAEVHAAAWANSGPRVADIPPLDRESRLGRRGLVSVTGEPTVFGTAWREQMSREHERRARTTIAARMNIADYYANLPESVDELYAAWEGGLGGNPAMLD
ncbi:MAG: hypothetical protein JOZ46_06335 [Candidatus Dormibacteraeota bacterium]|nr:hypothetical protein [Candidatus Dormibacteraeota bacterium]MBV9525416.1 hypothetical protein [Candidatus Dormibacteraeota bacterium]